MEELHKYLREVSSVPFQWGVHDCLIFTNTAFQKMHGKGWADDWADRYLVQGRVPKKRHLLQKEYGFNTFEEAVDTRLTRVKGIPPRGALVSAAEGVPAFWYVGVAMGISVGTYAAFVAPVGVTYLPIENINNAWVLK
jgi:hypothetical protein